MAPPEPLPAPGKIAHHAYEYDDCALLICVSPSNAAAMAKSAMIDMRIIVALPVVVFASLHIISFNEAVERFRLRRRNASWQIKAPPSAWRCLELLWV